MESTGGAAGVLDRRACSTLNRWWIVFAGFLGTATAAGVFIVYVFGVFAPAMSRDLGFSPAVLSRAVVLFLFVNGLSTLMLGRLISRFGIVRPSLAMVLLYGATLLALPLLPPSPALFYLDFALMGAFTGAVCGMPYAISICGYFNAGRGLALGLAVLGGGVGAAISPLLANAWLEQFGWRTAMLTYCAVSIGLALLAVSLVRTPPGVVLPRGEGAAPAPMKLSVLNDRVFWIIALAITGNALAAMGLVINLVPLLTEQGVAHATAAGVVSVAGLAALVGRPITGYCLDRFFAPRVAAVIFLAGAVGIVALIYGGAGPTMYFCALMAGFCIGAEADLLGFLCSRYFDRARFSQIIGIMWVAWSWGSAVGSYLATASAEATGSYQPALVAFVGFLILSAFAVGFLPPYRHRD